ncbi:ABC transporter ATP-binding protein [Haloquadratum walsbyi]|jgi:ABC-type multidrug transport system, ATPase component|uniref:ABC-type multidrug transport system, ATPase component n=1 Tax=Haloquadratum walsbyi J07HQW2 TaxID=1238425 RepID=U1PVQ4_9EURY|nr:ABC transporter ATP-binding protein [Haloquadratum walsbyi]ERG96491.1 MAG: ABC-type multidrug transport system, ATPase component [Haloquadratum walsbyi J07HQW2]
MTAALVAENVSKSYGDVTAVDDVSVSVDTGEMFGLVGPNGAGKTTLVRALTGTTAVKGQLSVLGVHPTELDKSQVGVLPQSFTPPGRLTAYELIEYYAGLYDDARDPASVLTDVGLSDSSATQWYETLSGGQKRRVCVAITLINDPAVLFLDEPTTGIDPAGRRSLWKLLETLAAGGTTVFLTSHSMTEVERLADRVGFLNNGKLLTVGDPQSLIDTYAGGSQLIIETKTALNSTVFSSLPFDTQTTASGTRTVIEAVGPRDIGDVINAVDMTTVTVESLTWKQPNLEDVYLELAGEPLSAAGTVDKLTTNNDIETAVNSTDNNISQTTVTTATKEPDR